MTTEQDLLVEGRRIGKRICRKHGWTEGFACSWSKGFARGWAKGFAFGKAEAVVGVLKRRKVPVSAALRKRVLATRDVRQLEHWFDLAFTVASAKELFEPSSGRRLVAV